MAAAAARRQRRQEAAEAAAEATVVATGVAVPGPEAVLDKKQHYGQNQSFFIEKGVWIKGMDHAVS